MHPTIQAGIQRLCSCPACRLLRCDSNSGEGDLRGCGTDSSHTLQVLGLSAVPRQHQITGQDLTGHMDRARLGHTGQPAEACSDILHLYYVAMRVSNSLLLIQDS